MVKLKRLLLSESLLCGSTCEDAFTILVNEIMLFAHAFVSAIAVSPLKYGAAWSAMAVLLKTKLPPMSNVRAALTSGCLCSANTEWASSRARPSRASYCSASPSTLSSARESRHA